jgi:hypothetical protein
MTPHVLSARPITPFGSSERISEFESNNIIIGPKSIEMENIGYEILETNGTMLRKLIFKGANIPANEKPAVGFSQQPDIKWCKTMQEHKVKKY